MNIDRRTTTSIALAMIALAASAISGQSARASDTRGQVLHDAVVPAQLAQAPDAEKLTYWIVLRERADLTAAPRMKHEVRGRFVVDQLRATAERSQAGLRALLRARGADVEPFWAANVIRVTSDKATLTLVARRPEVERIETDRVYSIPEPQPSLEEAQVQAVEWNIANVRANDVWATFGTRGEGIVVASIDTGVQFNHPALVNQYRGNLGGGAFDHNYNWYDPSLACGNPSTVPCDNNNHGTHTTGTIAGDDGGTNQIGVAPGVRWIAAKGCESGTCSLTALVAAGQWMLAPTDLAGRNPRPDLRPNIVSNSWGAAAGNTFYQQIVQSWVAAGILPVFANGNNGPGCGTASSPGDYADSYAVGAYDVSNLIASFSSRGASAFGGVKPNISAPGVNVRSSIPGNLYASFSGTSMATPHVAGIVALMWSAAPALIGDTATTHAILDQTAIDTADATCGGTVGDNNVYGHGRVDAFAAVNASPRAPTGTLRGLVTDGVTGSPAAAIEVRLVGPSNRTTVTNAGGTYSFTVLTGSYDITASGFGYVSQTAHGVWAIDGGSTVQNFSMTRAPSATLTGTVRDSSNAPVPNAKVTVLGTPIPPVATDANGAYRFDAVPTGSYDVRAEAGHCSSPQTQTVALNAGQRLDFLLPIRSDSFGYSCTLVAQSWIEGTNVLALSGDDVSVQVTLPFNFGFYGSQYSTASIASNGFLTFAASSVDYNNGAIPSAWLPNGAVYPLWDDLILDASSSVRIATVGTSPNRQFIVEWRDVAFYGDVAARVDFEVVLGEGGEILMQYRNISAGSQREQGYSATIGLENPAGTVAFQYAANEGAIAEGLSIRYGPAAFTGVHGNVADANDRLAIASATVRALRNNVEVQRVTADPAGYYRFNLSAGSYAIDASASGYQSASAAVNVASGAVTRQDFALRAARVEVAPASLSFTVALGRSAQQTLTISNTGGLSAVWQLVETGDATGWLSGTPMSGTIAPAGRELVQIAANAATTGPGTYSATLLVQSNSARRPSISVPVTLVVTRYAQAINVGGPAYSSGTGVNWSPDARYTANAWGYTNANSTADATRRTIASTAEVVPYQTQRVAPGEYRFDGLAPGTYEVTVGFAEFRQVKIGARVVDVVAEGTAVLPAHDIMSHARTLTADTHTFTIAVNDGQLNLQFVARASSQPAIVSVIRVVQLQ